MNSISPQLQNQINQYQQLQQQLQAVTTQRMQMESQLKELKHTSEELAKAKGAVYRNVGGIMFEVTDKEGLAVELEDSVETMEIRVRGLKNQEASLKEKYEALGQSINAAMGNAPARRRDSDDEED
ncbi:MAG: prefoldin subunit beta [Thermoplasmata archaeon]|nr:prefoldin subunit beta [Thermoplasmata archaeon]